MRMFQLAMRESTISKHGAMCAVAASTSALVTPGPCKERLRISAISASARGWIMLSLMLHRAAIGNQHAIGEEAEVRLVYAEHVLHRALVTPIFLPMTRSPARLRRARMASEMA